MAIPAIYIYVVIGLIVLVSLSYGGVKFVRGHRGRRARRALARVRRKIQRKQKDREELEALLPGPWIDIYDTCKKLIGCTNRTAWLQQWTQAEHDVPPLSAQSIDRFAGMVGCSFHDGDYRRAIELLAPFAEERS